MLKIAFTWKECRKRFHTCDLY